jgi:hypothetical protein
MAKPTMTLQEAIIAHQKLEITDDQYNMILAQAIKELSPIPLTEFKPHEDYGALITEIDTSEHILKVFKKGEELYIYTLNHRDSISSILNIASYGAIPFNPLVASIIKLGAEAFTKFTNLQLTGVTQMNELGTNTSIVPVEVTTTQVEALPWWKSKTIIGIIVLGVGAVLGMFKIIPDGVWDNGVITDKIIAFLEAFMVFFGFVMGIYGRITASKKIASAATVPTASK